MNHSSSPNFLTSQSSNKKPLGQLLNEAGLISAHQIEIALQEQVEIPKLRIGEIFSLRGWINQETADFFAERWEELLQEKQKRPLVYYLRRAALLNDKQINFLMELRKSNEQNVKFHQLAIKHGLLKKQTVDFFVRNLLASQKLTKSSDSIVDSNISNVDSNIFSVAKPYQILQSYIRGETNFQRSELKKIKLNHVTLQGVNFDSSNLIGAEFKQADLSNSSLRLTNLTGANLKQAVLKEVDFECACLSQVNLTDADLEGSNFRKAILREADLRDGYLVNVCFEGADLRKSKLQGANLQGASYDSETVFDPEFDPLKIGMELIYS